MARAFYHCPSCKSDWYAMSTMSARLGTSSPVHCDCGEVATLKEIIRVEIGSLNTKSADEIRKHEEDWAEDPYHANILMGAKALKGSPDWVYHTQWSSGTTLWWHVNGKQEAVVRWDEHKGWVVEV